MTDISSTEYITVNKQGVFVGDETDKKYRGKTIGYIRDINKVFADIQSKKPEVQELHCGAFEAKGTYAQPGNPSGKFGPSVWCRVKLSDGRLGPWVFLYSYGSASECASYCAINCVNNVNSSSAMCSAVLNLSETGKIKSDLKQVLQEADLSKYVGKKIELNGYVVTVQKQR